MTKDPTYPLTKKEKKDYKEKINKIRDEGFQHAINQYGDDIEENLGKALLDNLPKILPVVLERSAKWWINPEANKKITKLIEDGELTHEELHNFTKSVSNTLRPLAGGTFETMVSNTLNQKFEKNNSPLRATTTGPIRKKLKYKLEKAYEKSQILKPDIDIVVYNKDTDKIIVIVSCKTTFRERLMQSISWKQYFMSSNDNDVKNIKVLLVTAWETLEEEEMVKRVAILDGVYVTNKNVKISGNIKKFDSIYDDIKKLAENQTK